MAGAKPRTPCWYFGNLFVDVNRWLGLSPKKPLDYYRVHIFISPTKWLIIRSTLTSFSLFVMASQDQISQFSAGSQMIPPSQTDCSRTPRRHHPDWQPSFPSFRGPLHYAIATTRPTWPNAIQPLLPHTPMAPSNHVDTSTALSTNVPVSTGSAQNPTSTTST